MKIVAYSMVLPLALVVGCASSQKEAETPNESHPKQEVKEGANKAEDKAEEGAKDVKEGAERGADKAEDAADKATH